MDARQASQACRYKYSALCKDEIRLLRLQPGAFHDDLTIEIVHHALHRTGSQTEETEPPERIHAKALPRGWRAFKTPEGRPFYQRRGTRSRPESFTHEHPNGTDQTPKSLALNSSHNYEALSYTWGDASHQQPAFVLDGDKELKTLHVRRNLAVAMRYLRCDNATRTLWVDAICINQDDLDERAAQVKRMRDIYGLASKVIVWLGERSHDSSEAMKSLEYLGKQIEISTSSWIVRAFDPPASEPSWTGKTTVLPYSATDWQAIESFFERTWFERLWVLQEVMANSNITIQCGHDSIDWCFLRRAIIALDERAGVPATLSYRLNNKVHICFGSRGTFRDVLFVARQHLCQDPRDKLYGVLGLIGPKLQDKIVPSYERSFEDLYKEVFLLHSGMTVRLDLLTQCFVNEELPSSPSWVPDWRSFPYAFRAPEPGYQASGASKAEFRVKDARLEVTGVLIDKIVFAPVSSNVDPESLVKYMRELRPPGLQSNVYVTGEPMLMAWTRSLAIDLLRERFPNGFFLEYEDWEKTVLEILEDNPGGTALARVQNLNNLVRDVLTDMGFLRTEKGFIGFGPYALEEDDCVCVVLGVPTPLVIRPREDETYQVIGWAYVHGLMDSEALLGPLSEGWIVTQRFVHLRELPRYIDIFSESQSQLDDPRLGELPSGWRRIADRQLTPDDPVVVDYFENTDTGEVINYDPRMTADALRSRGVKLETLTFI